eukprot:TRINITY_DN59119_c0_g1_i1.p1 TRINITY_DN59119_c0_g1~~TRINITY_DN59119_c0_g1_i1.p1  ORF type:complete len:365 (+),score=67.47 TRINITY_DN59119_c0_g1_i1:40-1134(+)
MSVIGGVVLVLLGCILNIDAASLRSASELKPVFLRQLSPWGLDAAVPRDVLKDSQSFMRRAHHTPTRVALISTKAHEEPQDAEDEAMVQSALAAADQASKQVDEEVKQQFGFTRRSLVADEGPSLADYYGTAKLWDPDRQNSNSTRSLKMTVEKCSDLCEGESACKSFTFSPNGEGWCHLKPKCVDKNAPAKRFPNDVFSTFFMEHGSTSWFERSLLADEGIEIEMLVQQSLGSCKARCEAHAGCRSVTFHPSGICHLKDKCVAASQASSDRKETTMGYKTYYRPCAGWVQRDLVRDEGKNLETIQVSAFSDCLGRCSGNPKCRSVSFKPDGRVCKLQDKEVTADSPGTVVEQTTSFSTYYRPC